MKQTISEKAETAIVELNRAALLLARQMKSGNLDKPLADKSIFSANRKVRIWRKAYFARTSDLNHLPQLQEFHNADTQKELETANERFGRVLKHYAKAVGAEFQTGN